MCDLVAAVYRGSVLYEFAPLSLPAFASSALFMHWHTMSGSRVPMFDSIMVPC